ncbi:MAG TPA: hypothetical protein VHX52_12480 [Steroidobacteraceae bacterium]|jgi:hypothetical protein|nr:hypothetical protein [Steroidobacteraceae bacterium]
MQHGEHAHAVLAVANLREYFHDELQGALARQNVAVADQTEHYVVNLLTLFARSEQLFEHTPEGVRLKPLVQMLSEALEAPSALERERGLQRLGDVSLFVAGFFAHSFARKLVDIDYHIAMGGRAYDTLAQRLARGRRQVLGQVFGELAAKFLPLVDALADMAECARQYTPADILRLYEIWLKTGSPRARGLLRSMGVEATPVALRAN